MPRRPRLEIPGIPMHIVQRGVNRAAVFLRNEDRGYCLSLLGDALRNEEVGLMHVLMGNPPTGLVPRRGPHLAGDAPSAPALRAGVQSPPRQDWHSLGGTLQVLSGGFGRLPSFGQRYIELNPVRAAMVAHPLDHAWSSVHSHLGRRVDARLVHDDGYPALGRSTDERAAAWRKWLPSPPSDHTLDWIRARVASHVMTQ